MHGAFFLDMSIICGELLEREEPAAPNSALGPGALRGAFQEIGVMFVLPRGGSVKFSGEFSTKVLQLKSYDVFDAVASPPY